MLLCGGRCELRTQELIENKSVREVEFGKQGCERRGLYLEEHVRGHTDHDIHTCLQPGSRFMTGRKHGGSVRPLCPG